MPPCITCRSRFNFINSRHKLYEFLVHSCSFWGSTQTNSITSIRDTRSHCPQLVEESLVTYSISSIVQCMMGQTEGEEILPRRLVQMTRPIVLLHQRFFFFFPSNTVAYYCKAMYKKKKKKPGCGFSPLLFLPSLYTQKLKVVQSLIFKKKKKSFVMHLWEKSRVQRTTMNPLLQPCPVIANSRHAGREEKPCGRGGETDNQAYCMVVYLTSWIVSQELLTEAEMVTVSYRTPDLISVFDIYQFSHDTCGRGTPKILMWAPFIIP